MKNIKYGENKHNRPRSSVFIHTKTPSVAIQGNITAMRYRNDGNRSNLLLHIRANFGMILARDYAPRNTLLMFVPNNVHKISTCKKSGCKSYRPLYGPIETQGSCVAAATKYKGAHA